MRRDGHERRRRAIHAVSISDEKPLHMRQDMAYQILLMESLFQSQTRSRSTCDYPFAFTDKAMMLFQSQTRSRSTCDLCIDLHGNDFNRCFNLRREAAPHATSGCYSLLVCYIRFQSQTRSRSTCDTEP